MNETSNSTPSEKPQDPQQATSETPPADALIANAWQEAYRQVERLRLAYPNSTVRITEIEEPDDQEQHHLVVTATESHDSVIIRTELVGECRTRFLMLPGAVVRALRE